MGTGIILVGNFNTPYYIYSPSNLKIRKTIKLKYITDQVDLIDIYRIFYSTGKEYTFFSMAHGTFSNIDLIISQKETKTDKNI